MKNHLLSAGNIMLCILLDFLDIAARRRKFQKQAALIQALLVKGPEIDRL